MAVSSVFIPEVAPLRVTGAYWRTAPTGDDFQRVLPTLHLCARRAHRPLTSNGGGADRVKY